MDSNVTLDRIGAMGAPVIVIDDFHPDPESLVEQAATRDFARTSRYYPGVRARGEFAYAKFVRARLRELLPADFGDFDDILPTECNFSLLTLPPEETVPFQRIPHFDGTDTNTVAVLHYLCKPWHGGTAFYRHRSTGTEIVTAGNLHEYARAVDADVAVHGEPPPRYVNGSTPIFEQIAAYEPVFNRALVYRGTSLHSGSIPGDFVPVADPVHGRLTVNTFVQLKN